MRFLDKVRKSLKPSIPEGLSDADLLLHFRRTVLDLVRLMVCDNEKPKN